MCKQLSIATVCVYNFLIISSINCVYFSTKLRLHNAVNNTRYKVAWLEFTILRAMLYVNH